MTTEQQRKMLECAAKACGLRHVDYTGIDYDGSDGLVLVNENGYHTREWNPRANPADCAEMCAKLGINTTYWWGSNEVECQCFFVKEFTEFFAYRTAEKDHDNSRLKAWMYAATMCAAKTQGYEE